MRPNPEAEVDWEAEQRRAKASYEYEVRRWLAGLPPHVAEVARQFPVESCYQIDGRGLYRIISYEEHGDGSVTIKVEHMPTSFLPGVQVFGVKPSQLRAVAASA